MGRGGWSHEVQVDIETVLLLLLLGCCVVRRGPKATVVTVKGVGKSVLLLSLYLVVVSVRQVLGLLVVVVGKGQGVRGRFWRAGCFGCSGARSGC